MNQIESWYSNLVEVTADDKADFEVMLMDKRHPKDAEMAISGMVVNTLQKGLNTGIMEMLMSACKADIQPRIRNKAFFAVLITAILNDKVWQKYNGLVETMLDLLETGREDAFHILCALARLEKHTIAIGPKPTIKNTLIYRLVVVGEKANRAFDQNCC